MKSQVQMTVGGIPLALKIAGHPVYKWSMDPKVYHERTSTKFHGSLHSWRYSAKEGEKYIQVCTSHKSIWILALKNVLYIWTVMKQHYTLSIIAPSTLWGVYKYITNRSLLGTYSTLCAVYCNVTDRSFWIHTLTLVKQSTKILGSNSKPENQVQKF